MDFKPKHHRLLQRTLLSVSMRQPIFSLFFCDLFAVPNWWCTLLHRINATYFQGRRRFKLMNSLLHRIRLTSWQRNSVSRHQLHQGHSLALRSLPVSWRLVQCCFEFCLGLLGNCFFTFGISGAIDLISTATHDGKSNLKTSLKLHSWLQIMAWQLHKGSHLLCFLSRSFVIIF